MTTSGKLGADSVLIALVSPEGVINRIVRRATVDPDAGLKEGWRWLPVLDAYGEPFGDSVEGDTVYRRTLDPATIPQARATVRKSTVQNRLIESGKMDKAYALLTSNAEFFARWFAPDRPEVYCDDPDAVAVVSALELNPEKILAAD